MSTPLRDQIGQARAERENERQQRVRDAVHTAQLSGVSFGIFLTLLVQFLFRGF